MKTGRPTREYCRRRFYGDFASMTKDERRGVLKMLIAIHGADRGMEDADLEKAEQMEIEETEQPVEAPAAPGQAVPDPDQVLSQPAESSNTQA